jgi:hypothetical protein
MSISGKCILRPSSCTQALSSFCVSWNCWPNSSRNCVHRSSMLSASPSVSKKSPMSQVHPAVSGPLISIKVNAIFLMGKSNPATSWLSHKYPLTSSMKLSALLQSPVNIWGNCPIVLTSPAGATSCCGTCAGTPPGIPGLPGPPGPLGPPPLPGGPVHLSAALSLI